MGFDVLALVDMRGVRVELKRGRVTHFEQKSGYGFINIPGEKGGVYFRRTDGVRMVLGPDGRPVFRERKKGRGKRMRIPRRNEELIFVVKNAKRGTKAVPWSYASQYDRLVEEAAKASSREYQHETSKEQVSVIA